MNIRLAVVICLVLGVGTVFYIHAQSNSKPPSSAGNNGRYAVIAADIQTGEEWGDKEERTKTAIRIDTQTGQTWMLIEFADPGANGKMGEAHLGWVRLREIEPMKP